MKHTKGEWIVKKTINGDIYICAIDEGCAEDEILENVCRITLTPFTEQVEANAKLIASAPELLEALEDCLIDVVKRCTELRFNCTKYSTYIKAIKVIKKATDETH